MYSVCRTVHKPMATPEPLPRQGRRVENGIETATTAEVDELEYEVEELSNDLSELENEVEELGNDLKELEKKLKS